MKKSLAGQLGRRVLTYRKAAGMTQEQLAEAIGVTPETVSRLERGSTSPSIETVADIGEVLGVELHELFNFRGLPDVPRESGPLLSRIVADLSIRDSWEIRFARELLRSSFKMLHQRSKK